MCPEDKGGTAGKLTLLLVVADEVSSAIEVERFCAFDNHLDTRHRHGVGARRIAKGVEVQPFCLDHTSLVVGRFELGASSAVQNGDALRVAIQHCMKLLRSDQIYLRIALHIQTKVNFIFD